MKVAGQSLSVSQHLIHEMRYYLADPATHRLTFCHYVDPDTS